MTDADKKQWMQRQTQLGSDWIEAADPRHRPGQRRGPGARAATVRLAARHPGHPRLLAPALVDRIKQASSRPCDAVIKDALGHADAFELEVQKVTVSGDKATATVQSQASGGENRTDTLELQKVGAAWKIASLGVASGA